MGTGIRTLMPTMPTWMGAKTRAPRRRGEAAHAVAELVRIDQCHGLGQVLDADTTLSTGPKISSFVDLHVGRHVVKQRGPARNRCRPPCRRWHPVAAVHHQGGAFPTPCPM